jgi:hypothetical protein
MVKVTLCHACAGTSVDLKKSQRMRCENCGGSGLTKAAGTLAKVADNPKHWQNRGEEARSLAEDMNDKGAKSMILRNARDYDTIAARVEKRIKQAKHRRGRQFDHCGKRQAERPFRGFARVGAGSAQHSSMR